ncbi:MAG: PKD domain-containing protein [Desulforhabdus sp.]|jgi:PKD repeat protein|nr:PKD domain-containing protein [Desulforhabdus sp.]
MRAKSRLHYKAGIIAYVLAASVTFISFEVYAFKVMQTNKGAEIKWSEPAASFLINEAGGPSGSLNAILTSMQTWSDVDGSCFVFNYSGQTTAQTQLTPDKNSTIRDQKNIVSFQALGQNKILASNYFWFTSSSGALLESDIVVNTSYAWRTDGGAGAYDVQNVMTHELGHSLSLDDLYGAADSEKTMYGYVATGETKQRTLHQDDIDGIVYLYPGSGNQSPAIASYDAYPTSGVSPLTVTFHCSAVDYDGMIAQYQFNFGDGASQTLAGGSTTHTYSGVGSYQTSCVAFDNKGATTVSQTISITVSDPQDWTQIPGRLNQIACGDLNGNGLSNIAGATGSDLIFYSMDLQIFNYLPGRLHQLTSGDFNGDGVADLAGLTIDGMVFYSTGLSNWIYLPGTLSYLAAGDLNGDGRDDLVGVTGDGQIYYTLNLSTWQMAPGLLRQLACGDLNEDGKDDLVGLTDSGAILYTLDMANWIVVPGSLTQLTTGDLNGDGRDDLIGVVGDGRVFYTLNLSTWQTISGSLKHVASGDLDGDGRDDVAGLTSAGAIYYRLNVVD